MRGITVVGVGLDSGETLVAAAACAAARSNSDDARLFVTAAIGAGAESEAALVAAVGGQPLDGEHQFRAAASPVIAARHSGAQLDPATLVAQAHEDDGRLLIAAAPGGLLAPLTEHYSNRDFARELGLPLVIAARAVGGVAGQVRLAGEAARAAGLPVAAVVLTGWPDPPNRVQLDERELLTKLARVPVLALDEAARSADTLAQAAANWPLADWTAATTEPEAAAAAATADSTQLAVPGTSNETDRGARHPHSGDVVTLEPYEAWQPRQVGDPRQTPRPRIMEVMLEIVDAEGPMTAARAYSLYNRASGGKKLTSVARAPLSSAIYWLAREGKVTLTREEEVPWQGGDLVRLPDQPAVRVRELGPRTLDEVPLDEIAELIKLLRGARATGDPTELKRAVLSTYGLIRLTTRADEYLGLAVDLAS